MDKTNRPNSYAPVISIDFGSYQRVIAISDIHGDYDGFGSVLDKLNFTDKDALVIVGDILEKGAHSLKLLHEVMELIKGGNLYMVAGNNDVLFKEWYSGEFTDDEVLWYMHSREHSILIDMAQELNMPFDTLDDIAELKISIEKEYAEEITFLDQLPYIIDSPIAIFVHAGLEPGDLYSQSCDYCLTANSFGNQPQAFEKPVIVGHWPTSNYHETIIDINPYFNPNTNVYSIDGGNSMKNWQQINYLIFKADNTITRGYYDNLPKVRVFESQTASDNPITLTFPNTELKRKKNREDKNICYLPYLDKEMIFPDSSIYTYKEKEYCLDFTTYHLSVEAGEILSYCGKTENGILIKRDGIVGNYTGPYTFI